MRAKLILCFCEDLASKINLSPPWLRLLSVLRRLFCSADAYSLLVVSLVVCGGLVLGLCFVVQYFVSFLVLQQSHWRRESWLFFCWFILNLSFSGSSSQCLGLVRCMRLWHCQVIVTYFCACIF